MDGTTAGEAAKGRQKQTWVGRSERSRQVGAGGEGVCRQGSKAGQRRAREREMDAVFATEHSIISRRMNRAGAAAACQGAGQAATRGASGCGAARASTQQNVAVQNVRSARRSTSQRARRLRWVRQEAAAPRVAAGKECACSRGAESCRAYLERKLRALPPPLLGAGKRSVLGRRQRMHRRLKVQRGAGGGSRALSPQFQGAGSAAPWGAAAKEYCAAWRPGELLGGWLEGQPRLPSLPSPLRLPLPWDDRLPASEGGAVLGPSGSRSGTVWRSSGWRGSAGSLAAATNAPTLHGGGVWGGWSVTTREDDHDVSGRPR